MRGARLTRREQEVLHAVSRRLTNAEIADALGISVRTVESHVAALRRKLLVESRRGLVDAAHAQLGRPPPAAVDAFVGRAADVDATERMLRHQRWVTVTGAAGAGKSRLALEVARRRPAVMVPLDRAEPGGVLLTLASALSIDHVAPRTAVATCAAALSAGDLLLVLDDVDRVADEAADVAQVLLGRVEALRVLTTSRTPSHRSGEGVVEIGGLPEGDAVALFVDRSRAAARHADVSDRALVAQVCRRLDGVPLAIELAAARMRHTTLPELDRVLAGGFAALGAGTGASSPAGTRRHAALGAAFAWTWDLLDPPLREVLAHLAALPGPFDLALAGAAVGRPADTDVVALLDRSLLLREPAATGGPARFRVPGALREFVAGRTACDVAERVAERHAHHHAALAVEIAAAARTDDSPSTAARVHRLRADVAVALRWAARTRSPLAGALAEAVAVTVEQYGPEPATTQALAGAAADAGLRRTWSATVLGSVGRALAFTHVDLVGVLAARALDLAGRTGAAADVLAAEQLRATALLYGGRPREALGHLAVAARVADTLGDAWERGSVQQLRGSALLRLDPVDLDGALDALEHARRAYAAAGDAMHVVNVRYMMAGAAVAAPGLELRRRAAAWADRCVAYAEEHRNDVELGHAHLVRAQAVVLGREHGLAVAESCFRRSGDLRCLSRTLTTLAETRGDAAEPLLREAVDVAHASADGTCHRDAAVALVRWLWGHGRGDEASAALGAAVQVLGSAALLGRVPAPLVDELG
ncbi:LuxR C-terminal-related transcriptional regulator [Cellulomonas sp. SLBN-39]|uniref:ATP-binding protein n=1 Tax=Cellulomonas sp. SLBN-39 TaxID=2768446 RepID=UPI00114DDF17|nr:LuxR C-terminal-related transcriptional regulator [Cellulomonas sp. SLBN-39]TQL03123.1 putative ATPase [Cellulomonas sp. SLBN-39]